MGVARALDALTLAAARGALRVSAALVRSAFDAQTRSGIADGPLGIAVGCARTGHAAAAPHDVTRAAVAIRVFQTVDAARVPRVAHTALAVARIDTLDTSTSGEVAAGFVRRTVPVVEALHAATAALTGGVARLGAIAIRQALHAQVELAGAATRRLACAVTGRRARQRAGGEHAVTALVARAVPRGAALDADVAHARRLAAAAVRVCQALPAGTAGAERAIAGAVARRTALDTRGLDAGKKLERSALIQVAAARRDAQAEAGA
jgi:hypothetical protein